LLKRITISNIFGLQVFQVLRFLSFLIISVAFTKSTLSLKDIGDYELLLFIASTLSFFWVTGIIQSLLPLFNNNSSYPFRKEQLDKKSPEIFNSFLLLLFASILLALIGFFLKDTIHVYKGGENLPYANLLLIYILISNPVCLIEYIYLLYNKPTHILYYGIITFTLQVLMVVYPVIIGLGLITGIWGLLIITFLRFIWLIFLIRKYAEIKFSWPFIKEHIGLATPLIVSTLLSGSAQYIDGILVSAKFPPENFAIFRFGAKEMPLMVTLASGLNNAMLSQFNSRLRLKNSLLLLKKKSLRLMHILFPVSILLLFFSNDIFSAIFTKRFNHSADVFMVYLLLFVSRLLFPQTILIGLKKTKIVMMASILEMIFNVSLTLLMIPTYGIVGVAVATVIIFLIEKIVLIAYNYYKLGIKPEEYISLQWYFTYSTILVALFVLIDRRIINF
jgi:O-antigen/teichoic acid export membrane protein